MKCILTFLLFSLSLVGCGYKFGDEKVAGSRQTINVPFIIGDEEGDLTAKIIEQLVKKGTYLYRSYAGDLTLLVKIVDQGDKNIGFRYDRKKDGRRRKEVIPIEGRAFIKAQVTLIETCSEKTVLGPVYVTSQVDFDHDYYASRGEVNVFSLGQLNDYDTACEAVHSPLNRALAHKIVDFIEDSW